MEADAVWPPPDVRPGVRPGRGRRRGRPQRPGGEHDDGGLVERVGGPLPVGGDDVRSLIGTAGALLVVDGYNLARAAWADLAPEEERRRTVALLEEHRARTGVAVVVVFDGADDVVSPVASRSVRVRYSPSGVTADDVIADVVAAAGRDRPVVVVSSDRAVATHAAERGATPVPAPAFLAALRR